VVLGNQGQQSVTIPPLTLTESGCKQRDVEAFVQSLKSEMVE
jgi:hypothetical protein